MYQPKAYLYFWDMNSMRPRFSLHSSLFPSTVPSPCCCCCCSVSSVLSDSVRLHRGQPTRLPGPWDSPGKNTGVGCHFPLQCMKAKSESEVAQSCPILSDPMDCSLPGSSVHGIFQARVLEWGAIAFSNKVWQSQIKWHTKLPPTHSNSLKRQMFRWQPPTHTHQ